MGRVPFSMGFDIFSIIPFVFIAIAVIGIVIAVARRSRGTGTQSNDAFMHDMQHRQFMEQAQREAILHQQMVDQANHNNNLHQQMAEHTPQHHMNDIH